MAPPNDRQLVVGPRRRLRQRRAPGPSEGRCYRGGGAISSATMPACGRAERAPGGADHAWPDDGCAAADLVADPARRPLSRRRRDRVAHDRRADPPLHLSRRARPRAPARQRARAARRRARRPRRRRSPGTATATSSSTTRSRAWARSSHTINPRLFHDQIVYIVNHAEDATRLLRSRPSRRWSRSSRPSCKSVKPWVAMTDRAHMPRATCRSCSATRSCSPPRATISTGRSSTRTPPPRFATPRARPAIRRACSSATARRCCTPMRSRCRTPRVYRRTSVGARRSCRCSTSTPGAFRTRRRWSGAKLVFPGAALDGESLYELIESGARRQHRRRADRVAGSHQLHEAEQAQVLDAQATRRSAARPARRR